jgi:LysM repeat protein
MGNFEKLGILVIIILVVVILVLAVWGMGVPPDEQGNPFDGLNTKTTNGNTPDDSSANAPERREVPLDSPVADDRDSGSGGGLKEWIRRDNETARGEDTREPATDDEDNVAEEPEENQPSAEPPVEPAGLTHKVKKGDMLVRLARQYYGSERYWTVIRDANPGVNPDALPLGVELAIPHPDKVLSAGRSRTRSDTPARSPAATTDGSSYTVRKGDTLSTIALRTLGSKEKWRRIYDANREKIGGNPDRLDEGMVLRIP